MAQPVASISVPEEEREKFREEMPEFLELASVGGKKSKLSGLVKRLILEGQVLDKAGLQNFASKELRTTRSKYIVLILE